VSSEAVDPPPGDDVFTALRARYPSIPTHRFSAVDGDLLQSLDHGEPVEALLLFDAAQLAPSTEAGLQPSDVGSSERRAVRFAEAKQDLLAAAPASLIVERDYEQMPVSFVTLQDTAALAHVLSDDRVLRVEPNRVSFTTLAQSLPLINQPAAAADGKDGTGTTVAVLDTGADYTNPALGSCTAPGVPASTCKVVVAQDFAPSDGTLDDSSHHGTNVSSIVAGVAPGAKIIALDVFRPTGGYDADIIAAINWVIANHATWNIASINMSLGGGSYTAACPSLAMATALDELRKAGVVPAVATGNSGTTNAISYPACAPAAVAVGAVYDSNLGPMGFSGCSDGSTAADKVTCFSNSASFMTILAPGALITAGGITMAGTSQATPHVAGALAVLHGAFPSETPDELVARLVNSGTPVTDGRNGLVKPRLDLAAAAAGCVLKVSPSSLTLGGDAATTTLTVTTSSSCAWSVSSNAGWLTLPGTTSGTDSGTVQVSVEANAGALRSGGLTFSGAASATVAVTQGADTAPPTGTVVINDSATVTRARTVALTLQASDPSGVASMCVTNGTTCTTWETYATSKSWTLGTTQGANTVRVFWKDTRGNASSAAASASITLDTVLPTNGVLTATAADASVGLSWTACTDATSGIAKYRVVYAATTAPASCLTGTTLYEGTATSTTHTGLTNGAVMAYRVCAIDGAGNVGTGAIASAMPKPESDAPVGSLTLNGGATLTRSTGLTVTLSATDASTVSQVCLSTAATCTAWQAYGTTKAFTLPSTQGSQTVSAWFKDQWNNTSSTPVKASITLDTVVPTNPTVTSSYGDASVTLTWTGGTDATSGVAGYRVVYAATTAPATCAAGTTVYEGSAQTFTHTGLTNGAVAAYRVCTLDRAGNISTGVITSAQPRPESDAPVGSLSLNADATWTKTAAITVTLSASDASTVTQVCLSTAATCTAWQAFATTKAFTLANVQGTQTVSAWFKDQWNNVTPTPVKASIKLDSVAPTSGVLTATFADASVALSWTAGSDANSGVAGYRVVSAANTAPANCLTGTIVYEGADQSFQHTGLTNGAVYGYRVCTVDVAGNLSTGTTATAQPRPEADAPVGTITLNAGATFTRTTAITVSLSATDASTVTQVCLSTAATCTAWQAFATTKAFTLANTQGTQTVSAWFKDQWNNVTAAPVKASITLDSVAPAASTLTAQGGSLQVVLTWSASSDAGLGLAGYKLVGQTSTSLPASLCATGTVLYTGTATTFTDTGLTANTTRAYRLCPLDNAGNVGTGTTATVKVTP
jgi:subtilisin family serine protease